MSRCLSLCVSSASAWRLSGWPGPEVSAVGRYRWSGYCSPGAGPLNRLFHLGASGLQRLLPSGSWPSCLNPVDTEVIAWATTPGTSALMPGEPQPLPPGLVLWIKQVHV